MNETIAFMLSAVGVDEQRFLVFLSACLPCFVISYLFTNSTIQGEVSGHSPLGRSDFFLYNSVLDDTEVSIQWERADRRHRKLIFLYTLWTRLTNISESCFVRVYLWVLAFWQILEYWASEKLEITGVRAWQTNVGNESYYRNRTKLSLVHGTQLLGLWII